MAYFIVQRETQLVIGPLDEEEFPVYLVVLEAGAFEWRIPENPRPEVARSGKPSFLMFLILYYGLPLLVAGLLIGFVAWCYRRYRKRRLVVG